ncbi:MAG: hypothetical protein EOO20_28210, partial [Chryseobacterium sp.]
MKCFYKIISFCVVLFSVIAADAQELEGEINFHGFIDNREYAKSGRFSQTIFGSRISPEIGLLIDSTHRLRVGINALQEFGDRDFFRHIDPVIYYQYQKRNWSLYLGAFPRINLLDDYPRALLADTLNYFRPNVEGMLAKYETSNFKQTIWIDWTGKQTNNDRETFLFGFSGKYQPGRFFISHYAYMFHNALSGISPPNQYLEDNGAIQAQIGLDFSRETLFDSLTISAGGMMSIERVRALETSASPKGFVANLHAGYKKFSLANAFYSGEGHHLINGDPFYTAKVYNRLDLG